MAESIMCYGIRSKFGLMHIEKIKFDGLGESGHDFQIAFNVVSESNGNGYFESILFKDGDKVSCIEIDGWKVQDFHLGYNWGETWINAEFTDMIGKTEQIRLAEGKGSASSYQPTYDEIIYEGLRKAEKIAKTYSSIEMYKLCEHDTVKLYISPSCFPHYYSLLEAMHEYCKCVGSVGRRIRNDAECKDYKIYDTVLKPKVIEYMDIISKVRISPEQLDPEKVL